MSCKGDIMGAGGRAGKTGPYIVLFISPRSVGEI